MPESEGTPIPHEHGDKVVSAKEEVRIRLEDIDKETKEEEKNIKKQKYGEELKKELDDVESLANEVYVAALRNSGNIPIERLEDAFKVRVTVTKVLEAVKFGIIEPPRKSKYILTQLANVSISQTASVNLFKIIKKYLVKEISFSAEGESETDFEKDFENLKQLDPANASLLKQILIVEGDHIGLSKDDIDSKFKTPLEEFSESLRRMDNESFTNTMSVVIQRYSDPEDKRLLYALIDPENLERYMEDFVSEIKVKGGYRDGDEILYIETSKKFKEKVRMLVGKLFQTVDESRPDEFWEEAEKLGGLFSSIEVLSQELFQRIQSVRGFRFSRDSIMNKMKFFRQESVVVSLDAEVNPFFEQIVGPEVRKEDLETRKYVLPGVHNDVEIDFGEYFFTVLNSVNDEIETRKFFHNARALVYHPPQEGGYHKQLSVFAERLTSSNIDHISELTDADSILTASQLWASIYEIDLAMHNWIHQPLTNQVEESIRLTDIDATTLEYLSIVHPDLLSDPWRLKRALIMGIGDNYSISLRALELGAYADPPLRAGKPIYGSYDKRDAVIYRAFNILAHDKWRWLNERSTMGRLLFLPLDMRSRNHEDLYREMMLAVNSFAIGRTDEDLKRMKEGDVVRLADKANLGNIGGIYHRASWRMYLYYEGWLIEPSGKKGDLLDIFNSWRAVEKVGVSALRDFAENIVNDKKKALFSRYDEFFGKKGDTKADLDGKRDMREKLVRYVFKKYFKDRYKDDSNFDEEFKALFNDLESYDDVRKQADAYKTFFYMAFARAYRQRMPLKLMTLERRRKVSTERNTAWMTVRDATGLSNEDFKQGVNLIAAAEMALKNDVRDKIKEQLKGKRMHEIDVPYELTEDVLQTYLRRFQEQSPKKIGDVRINNAMIIFKKLNEFIDTTKQKRPVDAKHRLKRFLKKGVLVDKDLVKVDYIDDFAIKYKDKFFEFEIGTEELQREFLTHRAAGERVVARNINDNATMEEDFINQFAEYFELMMKTFTDQKRELTPLIESMQKAKLRMEQIHGLAAGYDIIAKYFVPLTIGFFKKDDAASFFPTNLFRLGKKNCLAEEFIQGPFRGGWPWDASDRRNFFIELERAHLLPKVEHDVLLSEYEIVDRKIKIFGKEIKIGKKRQLEPAHIKKSTKTLRKENASTNTRLVLEKISKYLPILIIAYVAWLVYKSAKEAFGNKSQNS